MSLLEVLISIFVILFGLLSVASLLRVGQYEVAQTLKSDQVAAVGHAALREIQVRRMLDPQMLYCYHSAFFPSLNATPPRYRTYCLDPLGVATYTGPAQQMFPADSSVQQIFRVTPANWNRTGPISGALADRIFTWRDDLVFDIPGDKTARPRQLFRLSDGTAESGTPTSGAYALSAENEGNYSWMATVTPLATDWEQSLSSRKLHSVSVVVFHKRTFDPASEIACPVNILTSEPVLLGGGDVELTDPVAANVKSGDWILLCGANPQINGGSFAFPFCTYKWYRVIATDEYKNAPRRVTLAGPDWNADPSSGGNASWNATMNTGTKAVLIPGVVGVYTETIELEQ